MKNTTALLISLQNAGFKPGRWDADFMRILDKETNFGKVRVCCEFDTVEATPAGPAFQIHSYTVFAFTPSEVTKWKMDFTTGTPDEVVSAAIHAALAL